MQILQYVRVQQNQCLIEVSEKVLYFVINIILTLTFKISKQHTITWTQQKVYYAYNEYFNIIQHSHNYFEAHLKH
jgi:hypothetical protein